MEAGRLRLAVKEKMDANMIWTAILKNKDNTTSKTFLGRTSAKDAYDYISHEVSQDTEVLGIMKGSHEGIFYGVNRENELVHPLSGV